MFKNRIIAILLILMFSFSQVNALGVKIVLKSKYDDALDYLEMIDVIEDRDEFETDSEINKVEFLTMILRNVGVDPEKMQRKVFPTPFEDVSLNDWFAPYVYFALEKGLIESGDYFYPEKELTRFEALKLFFTLEGVPTPLYANDLPDFTDVSANSKVAPLVHKALELDLMTPETKDVFGILHKITKGDVALMLYQYAVYQAGLISLPNTNTETSVFDDLPKATVFLDVWQKVHDEFLFRDQVDDEEMMEVAIEAIVETLDDPFSVYMPPEEGSDYSDSLEGELQGIGAYIGINDGKIIIVSPIKGTPADEAGLLANDQILEIDGEDVTDFSLSQVVQKLRGEKGTQVTIKILRDNVEKTFTITRATIELKSVDFEMQGQIAVIGISQFLSRTSAEFEEIAEEVLEHDPEGIVLDLRNNPGGYLGVAEDVLGHFVENGEIILEVEYPTVIFEEESQGNAELAGIPLVVLINGGSASASEIVAGALQDLGLAKLIGKTSYGKGTVQELTYYTDDSNLKLTIAKWLTPNGTWVHGVGITPDLEVENDAESSTDAQMERALEELN